jgi:hypothetical protein
MKMPWAGKSGLAQAAAIFATLTLVSLGLCGANFVAVIGFVPMGGGAAPQGWRNALGGVLTVTGVIELIGMAVGIVGLVGVGIAALVKALLRDRKGT